MEKLILFTVLVSAFCVGLRIISSPGMLLYFLRKPYERYLREKEHLIGGMEADKDELSRVIKLIGRKQGSIHMEKQFDEISHLTISQLETDLQVLNATKSDIEKIYKDSKLKLGVTNFRINLLKPVIGCITCMASVWTLVWALVFFYGVDLRILIAMGVVAFLNSILYALYELVQNKKKCNC